ncbi:MAG: hypothetical protein IT383_01105 [Deltaproteobacteria bacterium]|nr:hypothetical protein [Deltaproteobacteria bacterium]
MDNATQNRLLLRGLEAGLGEEWVRLCSDLKLPSRDKWPDEDFAEWESDNGWDLACIESAARRNVPIWLSLTVDAARWDPARGKTELDDNMQPRGFTLSVVLEIVLPKESREKTEAANARNVAAILAAVFPGTLAGDAQKILLPWPNKDVQNERFPRLTLPIDYVLFRSGGVLLSISSAPIDEPCRDPEAAGRRAATEILQQWAAFSKLTHYLRALYYPHGDKKARTVTDEELMGLLGEAVYAVRCGTEATTWLGGYNVLDFRQDKRLVEVKTGVGTLPREPFFSHRELLLGSSGGTRDLWDVVLVGLDEEGFQRTRDFLDGIKAKATRAPFEPEVLSGRAFDIAVERMSRAWGIDDSDHKKALRGILKDLAESERTTIRPVKTPFAGQWAPLTEAAVRMLRSEVRVAIDPS